MFMCHLSLLRLKTTIADLIIIKILLKYQVRLLQFYVESLCVRAEPNPLLWTLRFRWNDFTETGVVIQMITILSFFVTIVWLSVHQICPSSKIKDCSSLFSHCETWRRPGAEKRSSIDNWCFRRVISTWWWIIRRSAQWDADGLFARQYWPASS